MFNPSILTFSLLSNDNETNNQFSPKQKEPPFLKNNCYKLRTTEQKITQPILKYTSIKSKFLIIGAHK